MMIKLCSIPHFEKKEEKIAIELEPIFKEPVIDALINSNLPEGKIYDKLVKNAAIFLANAGVGVNIAREIFRKFHQGKITPAQINQYMGWYNSSIKGRYTDFNKREINDWCEKYNWPILYPEIIQKGTTKEPIIEKINIKQPEFITPEFKVRIFELLMKREKDEATEMIVKEIERNYYIHTIRDDEFTEMWIYNDGIYVPNGRSYIKEICRMVLCKGFSTQFATAVIDKIAVDTYIDGKKFLNNTNINEIAVLNGILNVKTKELLPFTPEKKFFNKINANYNPESKCPIIDQHLTDVLKRPEDKVVMYEWMGFSLYRDYFLEKLLLLSGEGRNGKGKTIKLWGTFLGNENIVSIPLQDFSKDQYSPGALLNKMANLCGDMPKWAIKNTSWIKTLTGRDWISVNRKFLPRISFQNYAKQVFACNELPIIEEDTFAIWDRITRLEFPYTFISKAEYDKKEDKTNFKIADPQIMGKLTTPEELSGLLNMVLDGLKRIIEKGDFSKTETTEETRMAYIRKSDSFKSFLIEKTVLNYDSEIAKTELKKEYGIYCRDNKLRSTSDRRIKKLLSEMGISEGYITVGDDNEYGKKRVWVWFGVQMK